MSEGNITVDIGPVIKVLEALICEDPAPALKTSDAEAVLASAMKIYEVMQLEQSVEIKIHREIGVHALMFVAKRVATQKIAENSIKNILGGKA